MYVEFLRDLDATNASDDEKQAYRDGLATLSETLYPSDFNHGFRGLEGGERALLQVAQTRIEQESVVNEGDLSQIRVAIDELREVVNGADIPATLAELFLELIRIASDALARYEITGARGLRQAFRLMLGELIDRIDKGSVGETKKGDAGRAFKKLGGLLDVIHKATSTVNNVFQIGAGSGAPLMLDVVAGLIEGE